MTAENTMLTTAAISKALNVNRQRVHQLARARGVEPTAKVGGVCLWPADAIERLRPRATGAAGHARRTPGPAHGAERTAPLTAAAAQTTAPPT